TIEAVGDSGALSTALAGPSAGQHLTALRATYGIDVRVNVEENLSLPGSGQVTLRYASGPGTIVSDVPPSPEPEETRS
ncbi:MAG: DUF881 domain-containing protein, partial [Cellulomonas sp.]|nr:DUF881 domain-containing protein [Cellulomonas sp.]